jgi:hypothetical protein
VSFLASPDLSSGFEDLLKSIDIKDNSRSLIISLNLCSIKNKIQFFNLDLYEVVNLFSRQVSRDSAFQDCADTLFKTMGLEDNSRSQIIYMNLFSIKNMMIFFTLRDPFFKIIDYIIIVSCLGNFFKLLI